MKKEKTKTEYINYGTDEQMEIYGYSKSIVGLIITWTFIILTLGFLRLVFYWKPEWMLYCTHRKCHINEATRVLLKDKYQQWFVENVTVLKNLKNTDRKADTFDDIHSVDDVELKEKSDVKSNSLRNFNTSISARLKTINEDTFSQQEKSLMLYDYHKDQKIKFFINKRWKYVWNEEANKYERLLGLEEDVSLSFFHRTKGLTKDEQTEKRGLYGENSIRIHLTPIFVLFFREVLSPFYIFQVFSCALWYYDDYIYYASCIVGLSIISIVYSLFSIRQNERALRDIIHHASTVVVFRRDPNGRQKFIEEEIASEDLVPGDIIAIKNMSMMQCDAVLLNGNAIVNESMLTGESVPVTKTALSHTRATSSSDPKELKLDIKEHSRHILFSGTQVIQTRYYESETIKAVVLRTGFNTTKGELIRSILHPKPVDFRFNNDTYKYIGGLSLLALGGLIFTAIIKILKKNPPADIIKRSLDIVTIAVPPALPGALTAGLIYSQNRLKKKQVFCISPRTINICGTINTFVFDKTGTLTEDGLDLKIVLPVKRVENESAILDVHFDEEIKDVKEFPRRSRFLEAMATCHSITRIHGDLAGDPLDCKMFEFTDWELIEPNLEETGNFDSFAATTVRPKSSKSKSDSELSNSYEIGIIKQFPFSSSLQRMSVVVKELNSPNFVLYCKGSPEKVAELSKPETLPKDFQRILTTFTREGYRVIAVATRPVDYSFVKIQRIEREKLENDMEFLGLIVMENRLKPETCSVISRLKAANVRTIMCTGDNILTALSVARDCDMINEDDRVILIEANPGEDPKFTYAEIVKQKVKEIEFDAKTKRCIQKDKNSHFHFAVNGKSFAVIRNEHKDLFNKLVVRGAVFGRMSPDQKQQLVETLQDLGYFVGMCGDGANDCGALKAANSGISLSNAEASVASPFTSKNPNIECVPLVIREGRCALVTSFGVVKFICMYSLTQFVSVILLYTLNAGVTDFQFLYIDLFLVTLTAFCFSRTEAYPELDKNPPYSKLMAVRPIASLLGHLLIIIGIQVFTFFYVTWQPWFEAYEDSSNKRDKNFMSYQNSAVFIVSMFQYLGEAVIFSKGAPYRRSIFSNYLFLANLTILTVFSLILAIPAIQKLNDFFEIIYIPDVKYRVILVGLSVAHFFLSFIFETYIIDSDFLSSFIKLKKKDNRNLLHSKYDSDKKSKCWPKSNVTPYQRIEYEMKLNSDWPPITPATTNENLKTTNQLTTERSVANGLVDTKDKLSIENEPQVAIKKPSATYNKNNEFFSEYTKI